MDHIKFENKEGRFFEAISKLMPTLLDIRTRGFFTCFSIEIRYDNDGHVSLRGGGCVPHDEKDRLRGIGTIIELKSIRERLKAALVEEDRFVYYAGGEIYKEKWIRRENFGGAKTAKSWGTKYTFYVVAQYWTPEHKHYKRIVTRPKT